MHFICFGIHKEWVSACSSSACRLQILKTASLSVAPDGIFSFSCSCLRFMRSRLAGEGGQWDGGLLFSQFDRTNGWFGSDQELVSRGARFVGCPENQSKVMIYLNSLSPDVSPQVLSWVWYQLSIWWCLKFSLYPCAWTVVFEIHVNLSWFW